LEDTPDLATGQPSARIVVVSDDEQLCSLLCGLLNAYGYGGVGSVDTRRALALKISLAEWTIAVVDTSVSYDQALRVLRQLKSANAVTIAIYEKRRSASVPRELPASTDVLLGKPFDPRELLLVIRGMLGGPDRAMPRGDATVSAGPITLSMPLNQATVASREIELTGVEARILCELVANATHPVTREWLMRRALLSSPDTRCLDTHVSRLRRKIGTDRRGRTPIRTLRSVGYLLLEHWEPS
jgi:two-component system phosphate regulon response regulator OmpR